MMKAMTGKKRTAVIIAIIAALIIIPTLAYSTLADEGETATVSETVNETVAVAEEPVAKAEETVEQPVAEISEPAAETEEVVEEQVEEPAAETEEVVEEQVEEPVAETEEVVEEAAEEITEEPVAETEEVVEEQAEEPAAETEEVAEEQVEEETEEPVAERKVFFTSSHNGKAVKAGTEIVLTAHLEGYEGCTVTIRWQYTDDGGKTVVDAGIGESFTYEASENNAGRLWRVVVDETVAD